MKKVVLFVAAILLLSRIANADIAIETVAIGDAGNAADPSTAYGSVGYNYNIGKYEVTAGQYTAFLNAKANVTDEYGLYSASMWTVSYGCKIQRTVVSGGYVYTVDSAYANRPVNFVDYWDSLRFTNWLGNGQGTSSTETGAYTLNGYMGHDGRAIGRNAGWTYAVTSEDEWYKAAYYKGGGTYSLYANGTSVVPAQGTASNYYNGVSAGSTWDGTINGALEQNGTKDMMGNVWEWNEAIVYQDANYAKRGLRGGAYYGSGYDDGGGALQSLSAISHYPGNDDGDVGFRVSQVAEPSSVIGLLGGLMGILSLKRRKA